MGMPETTRQQALSRSMIRRKRTRAPVVTVMGLTRVAFWRNMAAQARLVEEADSVRRKLVGDYLARHRRDIVALLVVIGGVCLFHARGLAPGTTFLPVDLGRFNLPWRSGPPVPLQNWLVSDPLYQFYPFLHNAVNTIRESGSWPLWNPRILLGHPSFADPLAQTFYPVFAGLGLAFGVARGLAIGLWLHAVLAAVLTYGFLRTRYRPCAAAIGAMTYALSGYMVTWFETTFWVSTLSWLPGILWAFELAIRHRRLRYTALTALATALATLGGQFQFMVTFGLFWVLYALGRTAELARHKDKSAVLLLRVLVVSVIVAALLSAISTVPFVEFLALSRRALSQGLADPLSPRQLITLIIPDYYGNPAIGPYWGQSNYAEATVYAGLPALLLACAAPFWRRQFFVSFLSVLVIATVLFAVGGMGVQGLGRVPILKYASLHRSVFLLPLLIAYLAAAAVDASKAPGAVAIAVGVVLSSMVGLALYMDWGQAQAHWSQLRGPALRAVALLGATVALLVVRGRVSGIGRQACWGLAVVVFVDLYLYGSRFNPAGRIQDLLPPTPAVGYVREHIGRHRAVAYQLDNEVLFGPNILSIYGIAEGGGYSSMVSSRYHALVAAGDPEIDVWWMHRAGNMVTFSRPSLRLLDLLQIRYVVSTRPLVDPGVRAAMSHVGCSADSGHITSSHPVSGTFSVRDTAINRLDLSFRVYRAAEAEGELIIRMWRGADRGQLLVEARQDAAQLRDGQVVTTYFAPEKEAPGRTYVWEVATADGTQHTGVGLCTDARGEPAVSVYGSDWLQAYEGEVYVLERLAPLPRAFVVYAAEQVPNDAEAVERLLEESFDLRNSAVVAQPVNLPAETDIPASRAEIVDYQDVRVTVQASAVQEGLLVLGDQFHPGWRAHLDGQPTDVVRANHIMRGVVVPPGEHLIEFRFLPVSLWLGGSLSLCGVAVLIALVALDRQSPVNQLGQAVQVDRLLQPIDDP